MAITSGFGRNNFIGLDADKTGFAPDIVPSTLYATDTGTFYVWDGSSWNSIAGGGGGEANTASNTGTAGTGLFKQKTGVDLEFYKINGEEGIQEALSGTDYLRILLDINGLTADASPDGAADYVATYDADAAVHKKVLLDNLPGGGGATVIFATENSTWLTLVEPVDGDFSWVNQDDATKTVSNGGITLYDPQKGSLDVALRVKSAPTVPYTIDVAIIPTIILNGIVQLGVGFRQSSDGKLHFYRITVSGGAWNLFSSKLNSPTSFNSNYNNVSLGTLPSPLFLRIQDNNTNRICSISWDGESWISTHTVGRTDFLTADQVFFGLSSNNNTHDAYMTLIHWEET